MSKLSCRQVLSLAALAHPPLRILFRKGRKFPAKKSSVLLDHSPMCGRGLAVGGLEDDWISGSAKTCLCAHAACEQTDTKSAGQPRWPDAGNSVEKDCVHFCFSDR